MKPDGRMDRRREAPPNQALHLTGAAILVSRGIEVLQAAPAGELYRCADKIMKWRYYKWLLKT